MAKKKSAATGISKSDAIRRFIADNPNVTSATVIAEGAAKIAGENVTPGLVYQVRPKKRKKRPYGRGKAPVQSEMVQVSLLSKAADLLYAAGSKESAIKALTAVDEVRKIGVRIKT